MILGLLCVWTNGIQYWTNTYKIDMASYTVVLRSGAANFLNLFLFTVKFKEE
jgi:hypothetical protein